MGIHDGSHKFHETADEYIKKREDIDMHNKRIDNLKTVCINDNTTNSNYAINMACLQSYFITKLSETLMWEINESATAYYIIKTASSHEVTFDPTTRKTTEIYDQSLSQDNAYQNTYNLQPTLCTKANRINNRYYLEFNGSQRMISDIDLNPTAGHIYKSIIPFYLYTL